LNVNQESYQICQERQHMIALELLPQHCFSLVVRLMHPQKIFSKSMPITVKLHFGRSFH